MSIADLIRRFSPHYASKRELRERAIFAEGIANKPMLVYNREEIGRYMQIGVTHILSNDAPIEYIKACMVRDMAVRLQPYVSWDVVDTPTAPGKVLSGKLSVHVKEVTK